jgi:hypothetical protein
MVTGYGLGVRVLVGSRIFNSPYRPDRLRSPPIFLFDGHRVLFRESKAVRSAKLITHLQLLLRQRKRDSIHPLPHKPSWNSVQLVKHSGNFTNFTCNIELSSLSRIRCINSSACDLLLEPISVLTFWWKFTHII